MPTESLQRAPKSMRNPQAGRVAFRGAEPRAPPGVGARHQGWERAREAAYTRNSP